MEVTCADINVYVHRTACMYFNSSIPTEAY